MVEEQFLQCAMSVGIDRRIADLVLDCDQAIADYPHDADRRWLERIAAQKAQLLAPDLKLVVALTVRLAEETPVLTPRLLAAMDRLVSKYPSLASFHARLARLAVAEAADQASAA